MNYGLATTISGRAGVRSTTTARDRADTIPDESGGDYAELAPVDPHHYVFAGEIARGGMGRIRVARDRRLGRSVAIKELLVRTATFASRFEREARITARLQHPSIVSVHEAGAWPSGEPFFAMELVPGKSLDLVVCEKASLDERLALVPRVLAVADAIAYAHSQRVIHRDLKPHNVLLGEFGETVVIDWGLAKDLTDLDDELAASDSDHHGMQTIVGQVIGTPAYMPPEQAEGESVDERADVYALGAILRHVLTGRPPFVGRSTPAIIEAVRSGPPEPLRDEQPGVPVDLHAIVERAMARDPAERYRSARELADDLRRFETGQLVGAHHYSVRQLAWRWLKRRRAIMTVVALALVLVTALGVVAAMNIHAERTIAITQRDAARKFATLLLGDLTKGVWEQHDPKMMLDKMTRLAVDYYDRNVDATSDPIELRIERVRAHGILASLTARRGDLEGSRKLFENTLPAFDALARERAGDYSIESSRAGLEVDFGLAERDAGNSARARELFDRALVHTGALSATRPNDSALQQIAVRAQLGLGQLAFNDVRSELAEMLLRKAAERANAAQLTDDAGMAYELLAALAARRGDVAVAEKYYRGEIEAEQAKVQRAPALRAPRRDLAGALVGLGDLLVDSGRSAEAASAYDGALVLTNALSAEVPTDAEATDDHAIVLERVGAAARNAWDFSRASVLYEQCVAIQRQLAKQSPLDANLQLAQANTIAGAAMTASSSGDDKRAGALWADAQAILEPLATRAQDRGDVLATLAEVYAAAGKPERFFATEQQLAVASPRDAMISASMLAAAVMAGRDEEALGFADAAVSANQDRKPHLLHVLALRAIAEARLGRTADAAATARQAAELARSGIELTADTFWPWPRSPRHKGGSALAALIDGLAQTRSSASAMARAPAVFDAFAARIDRTKHEPR